MRYQHPELDEITVFLQGVCSEFVFHYIGFLANVCSDFGMKIAKKTNEEIWYRGYGIDPYVYCARKGPKKFLGGAFEVESYQDLER
jgi:hypothetical protein